MRASTSCRHCVLHCKTWACGMQSTAYVPGDYPTVTSRSAANAGRACRAEVRSAAPAPRGEVACPRQRRNAARSQLVGQVITTDLGSSGPEEFHLQALTEPCLMVSHHTALRGFKGIPVRDSPLVWWISDS